MKTTNSLKSLKNSLDKHVAAIAKERDALRELEEEIQEILGPTDQALASLEDAIEILSERL